MKLVKFTDIASKRKIAIKEFGCVPSSGVTIVVSDERAIELQGNNIYKLKLVEILGDVIVVDTMQSTQKEEVIEETTKKPRTRKKKQ